MEAFRLGRGLTILVLTLSGCQAMQPIGPTLEPRPHAPSAGETPSASLRDADAHPPSPADAEVLAAVEAFLEKTREFTEERIEREKPRATQSTGTARRTAPDRSGSADARPDAESIADADVRKRSDTGGTDPGAASASGAVIANAQLDLARATVSTPRSVPVIRSVAIRERSASPPPADANPPAVAAVNRSPDVHPRETEPDPDRFLTFLEGRAEASDRFDAEWRLRLTQLAFGRDAGALALSDRLPEDSRNLLSALLQAALSVRRLLADPQQSGQDALEHAERLRLRVADRADPIVSTLALCRRVLTFGVYDEMDEADLVAGRAVQTIVYSEIDNLSSEKTDEGQYRTRLSTRLEVLTADGRSVWEHKEPEVLDLCRRPRRDFFIAHRVSLPPTLPAGDYVLKVLVEDLLSGKVDEAAHAFTLHSALSAAQPFGTR